MSRYNETVYVPVEVEVYRTTEKALLIAPIDTDEDSAVWVPRSQCMFDGDIEKGDTVVIEIAEWIAEREGFI